MAAKLKKTINSVVVHGKDDKVVQTNVNHFLITGRGSLQTTIHAIRIKRYSKDNQRDTLVNDCFRLIQRFVMFVCVHIIHL